MMKFGTMHGRNLTGKIDKALNNKKRTRRIFRRNLNA